MQFISWLVVATILVSDSDALPNLQENPVNSASEKFRIASLNEVILSTESFTNKFIKIVGNTENGNYVVSPLSLATALGMLSYGAAGETAMDLKNALNLPSDLNVAKTGTQYFIDLLSGYKSVELAMASKVYFPFGIVPRSEFKNVVTETYRSETESIDFMMSNYAAREINLWCSRHTKNRINNIVDPSTLDRDTMMVLVNALYFKGGWKHQFFESYTRNEPFYVNGIYPKNVEMMYQMGTFNYVELPSADAKCVELPYESEGTKDAVSMFIILPNKRNGLKEMEKNLGKNLLLDLINNVKSETVQIFLPKFKIETTIELLEPLRKMGLSNVFDQADFSKIVKFPRLQISKAIQKVYINVDEYGTEAAAVTSFELDTRMTDENPILFRADHPFLIVVALRGPSMRANLFTARYTGPEQ